MKVYIDFEQYEFSIKRTPILFNASYNNPLKFSKKLKYKMALEYKPLFDILLNL